MFHLWCCDPAVTMCGKKMIRRPLPFLATGCRKCIRAYEADAPCYSTDCPRRERSA